MLPSVKEEIRNGFTEEAACGLGLSGRDSVERGSRFLVQRHRNVTGPGPLEAAGVRERPPGPDCQVLECDHPQGNRAQFGRDPFGSRTEVLCRGEEGADSREIYEAEGTRGALAWMGARGGGAGGMFASGHFKAEGPLKTCVWPGQHG